MANTPAGETGSVDPRSVYREVTVAAIALGMAQGVVLNVAFVYAALKLGFSIGGSTVAAIMGYAVLRGLLGRGSMVENNINQTIASGINTAGTGIVFTVPALYLLDARLRAQGGVGLEFHLVPLALAGIAGALLGVLVIVPLRKQMIEYDRLRFPTGVATAAILRSGAAGLEKAKLLACGALLSAAWKICLDLGLADSPAWMIEQYGLGIAHEELTFGMGVIPDYMAPAVYLSLMNLAAGLLAGKGGLPFFLGGALAWWVVSPAAVWLQWVPPTAPDAPAPPEQLIYLQMLRPLGIGVLVGGALAGLAAALPAVRAAWRSLRGAAHVASLGEGAAEELSGKTLLGGLTLGVSLFFAAAWLTPDVSLPQAALAAGIGTLWLAVAALIVAQATGMTDLSPMSGMALISVTLTMLLLDHNVAASMVVGAAVCVAIGQGADMMQDLKTGFMVGAVPRKQQLVQLASTWLGALIALAAIEILWRGGPQGSGGFGEGTPLPAPQGGALMAMLEAIQSGQVPIDKYACGAALGAALGFAPFPGLGVLAGLAMYLPFAITLGYGIGCLLEMALQRRYGVEFCERKLVPFAAGLIVGEALTGVTLTGARMVWGF